MNPSILQTIERAIAGGFKIRYQTDTTPEFDFIIFHPHVLTYHGASGYIVTGLVERHFEIPKTYYSFEQRLEEIRFVEMLPIQVKPGGRIRSVSMLPAFKKEFKETALAHATW